MTGTKEDAVRVMPMLQSPNTSSDDKEDIIEMLQDGKREDVIAPLSAALEDKDPEVVMAAIKAISSFDNPADIDILKQLSKSTTDDEVRQAAEDAIILLE
jgi:HEAT repeat protein